MSCETKLFNPEFSGFGRAILSIAFNTRKHESVRDIPTSEKVNDGCASVTNGIMTIM